MADSYGRSIAAEAADEEAERLQQQERRWKWDGGGMVKELAAEAEGTAAVWSIPLSRIRRMVMLPQAAAAATEKE